MTDVSDVAARLREIALEMGELTDEEYHEVGAELHTISQNLLAEHPADDAEPSDPVKYCVKCRGCHGQGRIDHWMDCEDCHGTGRNLAVENARFRLLLEKSDDAEPITEEWLWAVGFERHSRTNCFDIVIEPPVSLSWWTDGRITINSCDDCVMLPKYLKTRGDLRKLAAALGIMLMRKSVSTQCVKCGGKMPTDIPLTPDKCPHCGEVDPECVDVVKL